MLVYDISCENLSTNISFQPTYLNLKRYTKPCNKVAWIAWLLIWKSLCKKAYNLLRRESSIFSMISLNIFARNYILSFSWLTLINIKRASTLLWIATCPNLSLTIDPRWEQCPSLAKTNCRCNQVEWKTLI